ncbi:MAG: hypothetical protein QOE28_223, partial [Solirubrobacteraceae bacterium]|nr:hypothetical protein [Solirubrobacteraceae bacterium]
MRVSTPDPDRQEEAGPEIPPGLWERVRADPVRAPEHIALA